MGSAVGQALVKRYSLRSKLKVFYHSIMDQPKRQLNNNSKHLCSSDNSQRWSFGASDLLKWQYIQQSYMIQRMSLEIQHATLESAEFPEEFEANRYLHMRYMDEIKAAPNPIIQELHMIRQQNELLRLIKEKLSTKVKVQSDQCILQGEQTLDLSHNASNLFSSPSQSPLFDSPHHFPTETSLREPHRLQRPIPSSALSQALADIQRRCQRSTCQIISQLLREIGEKTAELKMVNTSIARFETENLILKEKLEQQTRTVVTLQDKLRSVEVEAVTKGRVLADKDRQLTKVQTALIVKEDLLGRQAKKLKLKLQQIRDKQNQFSQQRDQLDSLWQQLLDGVSCQNDTFKCTVFARCKQSLMRQRKALGEQQQALESQHDSIEKLLAKLKEHGAL